MQRNMQAISADFQELFRRSPLAAAQIETIITERLLAEAEAKIAIYESEITEPDKQE